LLADVESARPGLLLAAALFFVIRPAATLLALLPARLSAGQRAFIAWFGVRGVGSMYYLAYALSHGADPAAARTIADMTILVVAASIVAHGVSVTPLMRAYAARTRS
jgi:sodium/hydrogen antiporter